MKTSVHANPVGHAAYSFFADSAYDARHFRRDGMTATPPPPPPRTERNHGLTPLSPASLASASGLETRKPFSSHGPDAPPGGNLRRGLFSALLCLPLCLGLASEDSHASQQASCVSSDLMAYVEGRIPTAATDRWVRIKNALTEQPGAMPLSEAQEILANRKLQNLDLEHMDEVIVAIRCLAKPEPGALEVPDVPPLCVSPQLQSDVKGYSEETWRESPDHVERWLRVLQTFSGTANDSTVMTPAEAQTYADNGWPRWVPVVAALQCLEAEALNESVEADDETTPLPQTKEPDEPEDTPQPLQAEGTPMPQQAPGPFLTAEARFNDNAGKKTIQEGSSQSFRISARTGAPGTNQPVRLVYRTVACADLSSCAADIDTVEFSPFTADVASEYAISFSDNLAECSDNSGWCLTPSGGWQNQGGRFFDTSITTTDDNKVGPHQKWEFCVDIAVGLTPSNTNSDYCVAIDITEDDTLNPVIRQSGNQMEIEVYRDYAGIQNLILPSRSSDPVERFYVDLVASGAASIVIGGIHTKAAVADFAMAEDDRGGARGQYTIACRTGAGSVTISHPDGTSATEQFCR